MGRGFIQSLAASSGALPFVSLRMVRAKCLYPQGVQLPKHKTGDARNSYGLYTMSNSQPPHMEGTKPVWQARLVNFFVMAEPVQIMLPSEVLRM